MSTVVAFPGLNSLLKPSNRARLMHLPRVHHRCREAEGYLARRAGIQVDLLELLRRETDVIYSKENVSLAAVATIAIQLGVWDHLLAAGECPDWVMGCSLGDLTKAIVCGVCSFDAVANIPIITLRNNADINRLGAIRSVSSGRNAPFSADDLAWLCEQGLDVSPMSKRMVTVSGCFAHFESLASKAKAAHWRITPIIDFPIHSRYLGHYDGTIRELVASLPFEAPSSSPRAYSSMMCKPNTHEDDFRAEFLQLMTSPVYWRQALAQLIREHGVSRLINVGPCDALGSLSADNDLPLETVEADALLASLRHSSSRHSSLRHES
jgi:[acyl-carrier-protein] S-malonyltransferase